MRARAAALAILRSIAKSFTFRSCNFVRITAPRAGSHLAKTGSRAVINTSPEPFSNWTASFGEELAVGTLLWLAFAHPLAALAAVAVLVALSIWLIPKVWRLLRSLVARVLGWFGQPTPGNPP